MQSMNYTNLLNELIRSYSSQMRDYRQLHALGQKMLGKLTLSRGDMSGIMGLFEQKQVLLASIERQRDAVSESAAVWRREKVAIPPGRLSAQLDSILDQIQLAIQEFLETEDQLKRHLEHALSGKGTGAADGAR
jgi:hypothetical protein